RCHFWPVERTPGLRHNRPCSRPVRTNAQAPKLKSPPPSEVDSTASRWRALYPFAPHWMQTDAGRLHYLDSGGRDDERPTLLFVHGNPTWSFHWRRLLERFRDSHRVVAVDHIGCGLSELQARPLR